MLLLRHWQAAIGMIAAAILLSLLFVRTNQRDAARDALARERQERALFAANVTARSEQIARRFTENARRVEQDQTRISQEISSAYQARITDLDRRVLALRVQPRTPGNGRAAAGNSSMPPVPGPTGRVDAATFDHGLSLDQRITATNQAIRLEELQRWVRDQARSSRGPEEQGADKTPMSPLLKHVFHPDRTEATETS